MDARRMTAVMTRGRYGAAVSDTEEQEAIDAVLDEERIERLLADARRTRNDKVRALYLKRASETPHRNPSTLTISKRVGLKDSLIRSLTRDLKDQLERERAARPTDAPADAREDHPHG